MPVRMASIIQNDNNCQWGWRGKGILHTVGNVNWCSHYGKQYRDSSKKMKNRTTKWSSNSIPGYLSEENKTLVRIDIYTSKFIAALLTLAKIWIPAKFPSIDEWIKKMCTTTHTHTHTHTHTQNEILFSHKKRMKSCHSWQHDWT